LEEIHQARALDWRRPNRTVPLELRLPYHLSLHIDGPWPEPSCWILPVSSPAMEAHL